MELVRLYSWHLENSLSQAYFKLIKAKTSLEPEPSFVVGYMGILLTVFADRMGERTFLLSNQRRAPCKFFADIAEDPVPVLAWVKVCM